MYCPSRSIADRDDPSSRNPGSGRRGVHMMAPACVQHAAATPPDRERWIAAAVLVLLVVLRSIVFVFWEQSFFDSDQAITG